MVRGRAGGDGAAFNMGEMTVTRCVVKIDGGATGHAYVAGRRKRHAELAAVFDALLQDPARRAGIERLLIGPQAADQAARHRMNAAKSAATKVEFFTMVRGDNPQAGEPA
jgi:alpha-D-ribose 1-methylphosphonate 5-triphosphate synthase subunit PhnG